MRVAAQLARMGGSTAARYTELTQDGADGSRLDRDNRSSARRDRRRPLAHFPRPHQAFSAHERILGRPGNAAPHRRGDRQVVIGDFAGRRLWDESGCWNGCTANFHEHQKKRSGANDQHPAALERRVFAGQVRNFEHDTGSNPAGRARTVAAPEPLARRVGRRSSRIERIGDLLKTPAAARWVCFEPLARPGHAGGGTRWRRVL
jgi:hypothetical protein